MVSVPLPSLLWLAACSKARVLVLCSAPAPTLALRAPLDLQRGLPYVHRPDSTAPSSSPAVLNRGWLWPFGHWVTSGTFLVVRTEGSTI